MSQCSLHIYPRYDEPGNALASRLDCDVSIIDLHKFPDGESRIKVGHVTETVLVYISLDHPNEKLIDLIFAAHAMREAGAKRLVLVCPYICYMRQDKAFRQGEAVSQKIVGQLLARYFDRIVTVDPHLHRVKSLDAVFEGIETTVLSAMHLIAEKTASDEKLDGALLVGPDSESRQWLEKASKKMGAPFLIAEKERRGDREVIITLDGVEQASARPVVIIDDVISSGSTIRRCAQLLREAGAGHIDAMTVHALCSRADMNLMKAAGVARIQSCDGVLHETNTISLAPLIAGALESEI